MEQREQFITDGRCAPYAQACYLWRGAWSRTWHSHAEFQLIYVTEGTLLVECEANTWQMKRGWLHFLPPHTAHRLSTGGYEQLGIDIAMGDDTRDIVPLLRDYITEPAALRCPELLGDVRELLEQSKLGNRISQARFTAMLDRIVLKGLEARSRSNMERFDLELSKYLNEHMAEKLRLPELARHFHRSVPSLERMAQRHFGVGVIRLLQSYRLSAACTMLGTTDMRVSEIAERVGFGDPAHFSAFFRERMGESPSSYRRRSGLS